MKKLYYLLFVLCFITFNASAFPFWESDNLYVLEYPVNMPEISVLSEKGQYYSVRRSKTDLTIMVFWSQSCAPCLREMKDLEELYHKAKKDKITVMLIGSDSEWKSRTEERKFLAKYGASTVPFYHDIKNKLSLKLGIGSTPYTVIMNKAGKKVATIKGETDWSSKKLYEKIKALKK